MTLALPHGAAHTDPRCYHLRTATRHRVAEVRLLPAAWDETCRDCWRREVRRQVAERRARDEAYREQIRAAVQATPASVIAAWAAARARGSA